MTPVLLKAISRRWKSNQVLNHPYVTIITNAGSSIILVYSVIGKQLFFTKKARTESNWKTKHTLIFVLIILRAAFVMIVTYRWFKTCIQDIHSYTLPILHQMLISTVCGMALFIATHVHLSRKSTRGVWCPTSNICTFEFLRTEVKKWICALEIQIIGI